MAAQVCAVTFVIGGAKSGKSSFALAGANACAGRKVYIATAEALDEEMTGRAERHRQERGADWDTVEEPLRIGEALRAASGEYKVILLDCLTLWLSNLVCGNADAEAAIAELLEALDAASRSARCFVVSNEVGQGIVPDNELSRRFRELAGLLNQRVAALADEVILVSAGLPLKLKP